MIKSFYDLILKENCVVAINHFGVFLCLRMARYMAVRAGIDYMLYRCVSEPSGYNHTWLVLLIFFIICKTMSLVFLQSVLS